MAIFSIKLFSLLLLRGYLYTACIAPPLMLYIKKLFANLISVFRWFLFLWPQSMLLPVSHNNHKDFLQKWIWSQTPIFIFIMLKNISMGLTHKLITFFATNNSQTLYVQKFFIGFNDSVIFFIFFHYLHFPYFPRFPHFPCVPHFPPLPHFFRVLSYCCFRRQN